MECREMPSKENQIERFKNALRWQACADALGSPFEFQRYPQAHDLEALIQSEEPLVITDDTQMTMFAIEALTLPGADKDYPKALKAGYKRWLRTQTFPEPQAKETGLLARPEMYSVQAPGITCLSSIRECFKGNNDSMGCGTVMRALPFATFESSDMAKMDAALTHHHQVIPLVAEAQHDYMRNLMRGKKPIIDKSLTQFREVYGDGGWTAPSCWNIAKWSFEHCHGDWGVLLKTSILHAGDSDSTAAVAGALYGLRHPEILPPMFGRLKEKKALESILKLSEKLF